jgi:hypothetical protein
VGSFTVNVSTKWINRDYRDDLIFEVTEGDFDVALKEKIAEKQVRHSYLSSRYRPRRIAMGAFRRAKRIVGSLVG